MTTLTRARLLFIFGVLLLILFPAQYAPVFAQSCSGIASATLDDHTVWFTGVEYGTSWPGGDDLGDDDCDDDDLDGGGDCGCDDDDDDGTETDYSIWYYCVESGSSPSLSHVVFEIGGCLDCVLEAGTWGPGFGSRNPGGRTPEFGIDSGTGVRGVKFDEGLNDGEVERYYFVTEGKLGEGPIDIGIKAGANVPVGTDALPGPDANCATCSGQINGSVFFDEDGNGVQNGSEVGLDGHEVGLFQTGSFLERSISAETGYYVFNIADGAYEVDVNERTLLNMVSSTPESGGAAAVSTCATYNFGYTTPTPGLAAAGDYIWFDDGDGVQQIDEPGIGGIEVFITDSPGGAHNGESDTTDNWGWFGFYNLTPGTYTMQVDPTSAFLENVSPAAAGMITNSIIDLTAPLHVILQRIERRALPSMLGDLTPATDLTFTGSAGANQLNQRFDFAFTDSPLPVELTTFQALVDGNTVVLTWHTTSEVQNLGFAIEHAYEEAPFHEIALVEGYGTTVEPQSYTYRHVVFEPGVHRFRLKQIDLDGTFTYSDEVEASVTTPGHAYLSAYPNPATAHSKVAFILQRTAHVRVALYDVLGREVATLYEGQSIAGVLHRAALDFSGLTDGMYLVRLESADFVQSIPVMVVQ